MNCASQNSELTLVNSELNNPTHNSQIKNICHSVLARVSRGWNAFAKVDKTILQNVELPFNANEKDDTESEVSKWTNTNALHRCERSEASQNSELILVNSELKNPTHHSQIKNICHSVLDTESEVGEWTNTNVNTFLNQIYTFITGQMLNQVQHDNNNCHSVLDTESEVGEWTNTNVNTFLNQIYTFITGQMLNIPEPFEHVPSTLQHDTKGMANADSINRANNKKVGVK